PKLNPPAMKRLLLYIVAILLMVACRPVFYSPSSQHVPLLTEKDEFGASVDYVFAESTESMTLKAAYAVTPHWALMAGGSFHFRGDTENDVSWGDGGYIEAGGGYFNKMSKKLVYETYGLLGFGQMSNHFPQTMASYPNTNGILRSDVMRLAIQPTIGFKSKYFDAAISMKTSMLHYHHIRGALVTQNIDQQYPSSQQEYLAGHRNSVLLEPALTLRGGWDVIKLQLQGGASLNLS